MDASASFETRLALFAKRCRPLCEIFGTPEIVEGSGFETQRLRHRHAVGTPHDVLGETLCEWSTTCQHRGVIECLLEQARLLVNTIDKTYPERGFGINAFA